MRRANNKQTRTTAMLKANEKETIVQQKLKTPNKIQCALYARQSEVKFRGVATGFCESSIVKYRQVSNELSWHALRKLLARVSARFYLFRTIDLPRLAPSVLAKPFRDERHRKASKLGGWENSCRERARRDVSRSWHFASHSLLCLSLRRKPLVIELFLCLFVAL